MSNFNLNNYKHLCILYSGGGGGNHLANLISTIDGFEHLFDYEKHDLTSTKDQHLAYLKKSYLRSRTKTQVLNVLFQVHLGINHLDNLSTDYQTTIDKLKNNTEKNIVFGHWASFENNLLSKKFLEIIDNCIWMIVTWPSVNSIPMKRIEKHNFSPQQPEKYTLPLNIDLFPNSKEIDIVTSNITLADSSNGFIIEIEKFFADDGWDYLNDKLLTNLGISLHPNSKELHSIWFNGIKQDVL